MLTGFNPPEINIAAAPSPVVCSKLLRGKVGLESAAITSTDFADPALTESIAVR